jgi:hypothetical protein
MIPNQPDGLIIARLIIMSKSGMDELEPTSSSKEAVSTQNHWDVDA